MIPEIGVILGLYVVTRMLRLATDEATAVTVRVFGVITVLVTTAVIADVLVRGLATAKELERILPGRGGRRPILALPHAVSKRLVGGGRPPVE